MPADKLFSGPALPVGIVFALVFDYVTSGLESFYLVFTWTKLFSSKSVKKTGSLRLKNMLQEDSFPV